MEKKQVTVQAGIRLNQLEAQLRARGLGMSVLGSISEQSVAGAISTATHGSGQRFGNLSTRVAAMRLVDGQRRGARAASRRATASCCRRPASGSARSA